MKDILGFISTGLFYCVWGAIAFALLLMVTVLAVLVDISCALGEFLKRIFKKDHQHN